MCADRMALKSFDSYSALSAISSEAGGEAPFDVSILDPCFTATIL